MNTENLKKSLRKQRELTPIVDSDYLSTGSTLLNLACSGRIDGGFLKGHYFFIVGDSASGKTFLSLTCLAEASINPHFADYRFIYDSNECGAMMDIERFFGKAVAERLEPPNKEDGEDKASQSVEEFYYNVDNAVQNEKPFIYILDSMDSLTSEAEVDKFSEKKKAFTQGKETPGSYGDNKAKVNSANLRRLLGPLRESKSILIILNQTRDNLGFGFEKKTRSGGHALRFYATIEIWSSIKGKIDKTVRGKKRTLGIQAKLQIKKNRIVGRERSVVVPIYYSYGFDDIGGCIDYLIEEGFWKEKAGNVRVLGMGPPATYRKEVLIRKIEEEGLEGDIKQLVQDLWEDIEKECEVKRKKRYS